MLTESEEARLELILKAYEAEYKEHVDNWRLIETKSQGTAAVAGVFLAAAFAYVRTLEPEDMSRLETYALIGTVALLVATVVRAIAALRVTQVEAPPSGDEIDRVVTAYNELDEKQRGERLDDLYGTQLKVWKHANETLHEANSKKAELLADAQTLLTIAAIAAALLTVLIVL